MNIEEFKNAFNKGLKYLSANNFEKAEPLFRKMSKYYPCKEVYLNLGNCYRILGPDSKAIDCYEKANDIRTPFSNATFLNTDYPEALNNLGLLRAAHDLNDLAADLYLRSIKASKEANQSNWNAIWNLSNVRLKQIYSGKSTDIQQSWEMYETRFKKTPPVPLHNFKPNLQMWDGTTKVPHLVVLAEQGFGDKIMFGRYIQYLEEYTDKITVQTPEVLEPLFTKWDTCQSNKDIDADYGIPICSLAKLFHSRNPAPEWLASRYTPKVKNGVFDIGIIYSGSKTHDNNHIRTTIPGYFKRLEKFGNVYTLNPVEHNKLGFKSMGNQDWGDTLACLSKLDIVISIDTAIVHLCGSVGMPCWMVQPLKMTDFRWGDDSMGYNNMWYPSVKVFRNKNNWDKVFANVERELSEYIKTI